MWPLIFSLLLAFAAWGQTPTPILAVGSPAPNFSLPGVDGKIHRLADYAASPVLVVVFTCNHCPIAQMYEQRIQQLETDYGHRGVAIVAIQPNDPKAIRIDELDSSDISDSLEEMKIHRFEWPSGRWAELRQSPLRDGHSPRSEEHTSELQS